MDHFGIGNALQAAARIYFQSSRRTGRTTSLVDSLKDGDRVICLDARQCRHLQGLVRERKLDVECFVVPPSDIRLIAERGTPQGRTIFDHGWVEQFYFEAITHSMKELDHLQTIFSGFGEAHLVTRRKAEELSKWSF